MPTLLSPVKRCLTVTGALVVATLGPVAVAHGEQVNFAENQCQCTAVGVSADGSMYIGDANAARVQVFAADASFKRTISSGGGLNLSNLTDIERLPNGNLVLGSSSSGLRVMTPDGAPVAEYPEALTQIVDLAVDPSSNIYWTDGFGNVQRRDAATGQVTTLYTDPNGGNAFLSGITFNAADGLLYVVGNADSRVLRLTTSGAPTGSFGGFGNGPGELNRPSDIAADSAGDLYVTQAFATGAGAQIGIKKFGRDGSPAGSVSTGGQPHKIEYVDGSLVFSSFNRASKLRLDDPVVSITGPASIRTAQRATFSAANSSLPFGSISGYEWDLDGDGSFETNTGPTPTATRRYDQEGARVVRVRVTSSRGTTDTGQVGMQVGRSEAILDAPAQVLTGQPVTLNAARSAQGDSDIANVRFDRDGDGSFETDAGRSTSVDMTYAAIGSVNAGVQVTREGGVVDVARRAVTVRLAPPGGPVGASINAGAKYTNDPRVQLSITWPAFSQTVTIANDGGFQDARSFPVAPKVSVTLDSSGPERLPKTIYARFDGGTQTLTDDIILDETRPSVSIATIAPPAASPRAAAAAVRKRSYKITLKATDKTSGVAKVQFARTKKKPSAAVKYSQKVTVRATAAPKYVRAQDRAGNFSAWKTLRTQKAPRRR